MLQQIGRVILAIRKERGLQANILAEKANISKSYLSEIENLKKIPDLSTLDKICKGLEVPLEIVMFKAIKEEDIQDERKRKLVSEIKPLFDQLVENLYK